MPTIILNKSVFEELVGKTLPLEELKDRISMLGTDLESIEDEEIHVEIFPNRPDMLSEQGFARAFSSFISVKTGLRKYEVKSSGMKVIVEKSVEKVRPFTACAIIRGVEINEERIRELIQIQEKLHVTYGRNRKKCAIGIYPLDKIVFPITYKADLPEKIKFIPLDSDKEINAKQILEEHKKGQEFAHLLTGKEKYPIFIDAQQEILSMPPIINSTTVGEVTENSRDLFIECSGFSLHVLETCLNIIVTSFSEMGGKIESIDVEYPDKTVTTPNLKPIEMRLDLAYVNKILGLSLNEKEVGSLLERMGYDYQKGVVFIPAYRADILHQVDLVEDIAIAYGYENFEEEIPNVATIGQEDPFEKFTDTVREILVGLGLIEVNNYHLSSNGEIALKNALGEQNKLRANLLGGLLDNLTSNQHNEYPQNIFEIGRVFSGGESETGVIETKKLAIALCDEKVDFTAIKQILEALSRSLGLKFISKEIEQPGNTFIPGRYAQVRIENKVFGEIGEISPQILTNSQLFMPVSYLEINLQEIFEEIKK